MTEAVLVSAWQHTCCGDVVAVGDVVAWRLRRRVDRVRLARSCGEEQAARVTALEERHDEVRSDDEVVRGRVTGLLSVTCYLRPVVGSTEHEHEAVPGSAVVERRQAMRRRELGPEDGVWVGYVVDLDVETAPG